MIPVIGPIAGVVVYCALMIIYLPLYVLGNLKLKKTIFMLKLMRFFGKQTYSKLGLVSRRHRITDVKQVSTEEELDFLENRMKGYIHRLSLWTPREIVRTFLRRQTIDLISDEQLAYVILSTVFAHSVAWDKDREMYRLKMEGFEDICLFEGFYWDARHVLVSRDCSKIIIQVDGGEEFHSDAIEFEDKANYNLAKLHVQICLAYFAPGLSHNHVHFVFPSAMCLMAKKHLDHNGALYKLLSPHFRFTERINFQALRVGKATNNKRSQWDRFFFLWQAFPVTKEQFVEGVARKCYKHYIVRGAEEVESIKSEKTGNGISQNGVGSQHENDDVTENEECLSRCHQLFPPDYVTDPELQKVPYLAFLRKYYFVVRKFVKAMEPFIDREEWKILAEEVAKHVPRIDKVDMIETLTTYIHQVGLVHYCDHDSFLSYFAYRYGSVSITTPFEKFSNTEHWDEVCQEKNFNLSEIKKNPLLLMRQRDVMRTRCFLNSFVDFIPNEDCNVQLKDTEYNFDNAGAQQAAVNFMTQLREMDQKLKETEPPLKIPTYNKRDLRAAGLQVTPLERIVRTVCY